MKWLVLAFIVFLIGVLAEFGGFQYSIVANVFLPAGFVLVPVSIGSRRHQVSAVRGRSNPVPNS